jgi:hypothetical protein
VRGQEFVCGNRSKRPVTVAARSKAWNVFARLNTGIVGSNPARGMAVCVYSVFVLSCVGSGLATGWSLVQVVLPIVYKCKITEPHKEEAKARYGLQRHIRRRRRRRRDLNICNFLNVIYLLNVKEHGFLENSISHYRFGADNCWTIWPGYVEFYMELAVNIPSSVVWIIFMVTVRQFEVMFDKFKVLHANSVLGQ